MLFMLQSKWFTAYGKNREASAMAMRPMASKMNLEMSTNSFSLSWWRKV